MGKIYKIYVLLLIVIMFVYTIQPVYSEISNINSIVSFKMNDRWNGWALCIIHNKVKLIKTHNGGKTWDILPISTDLPIFDGSNTHLGNIETYFQDKDNAWIVWVKDDNPNIICIYNATLANFHAV